MEDLNLIFFICSRVYPAHANPTIGFAPIEKLLVHRNVWEGYRCPFL